MNKYNINQVSYLIAEGQSLDEIAKESGWSVESLVFLKKSGIHNQEISFDVADYIADLEISNRTDAERMSSYEDSFAYYDEFDIYAGLYEREDGDPEELDFE